MVKNIIIRPARVQESQQLSELAYRSKSYWGYSSDFMEACREELRVSEPKIKSPSLDYYVGELDGKITGFYALEYLSKSEFDLEALFVEPDHMGQGIGKQLITHAISVAKKAGARSMFIQGDPNAEKFYVSAGAVKVGNRESGSIPGRFLPEFRITL
ncbi:GNAT family N-acetyltransferase [Balneola sp. MJW-20]|uniref:GNAT family N-acetyltransferase n=1 Tax=Gracilimonas aurantiaca TaxID=3234185 RepID=UPI003465E950